MWDEITYPFPNFNGATVEVWKWRSNPIPHFHYIDVIMTTMASQITSLTVVYSIVYSDADKKTSKLRVTGLCVGNSPGPVNSPHKGPVTRKVFPFDDVIMLLDICLPIHAGIKEQDCTHHAWLALSIYIYGSCNSTKLDWHLNPP